MTQKPGSIGWIDLTVPDAENVRDFYSAVVGWESSSLSMGDYEDYCMIPPGGEEPVAGVCHARGSNAGLPPVWMMYIIVENLERSVAAVREHGGSVIFGPKKMEGYGAWCGVKDPAGAVFAIFEAQQVQAS